MVGVGKERGQGKIRLVSSESGQNTEKSLRATIMTLRLANCGKNVSHNLGL